MIFDALYESAKRGELLLVRGGMCHFHLRRDGQVTIREIIAWPIGRGAGTAMLCQLMSLPGASSILAKCPQELSANLWYANRGFECIRTEQSKHGRGINVWRMGLCPRS